MDKLKNIFGKKTENEIDNDDPMKQYLLEIQELKIQLDLEKNKNSLLQERESIYQKDIKQLENEKSKFQKEKEEMNNEINIWKEQAFSNSLEGIKKEGNNNNNDKIPEKLRYMTNKYKKMKKNRNNLKQQLETLKKNSQGGENNAVQEDKKVEIVNTDNNVQKKEEEKIKEEEIKKKEKEEEIKRMEEINGKILNKEKEIEELKKQIKEIKEESEKNLNEKNEVIVDLNKEKSEMEKKLFDTINDLQEKTIKLNELQDQMNLMQKRMEEQENTFKSTEAQLKEEVLKQKKMIEDNSNLEENVTINSDRKYLFEELEKHAKTIEILTHENNVLREKIPNLDEDMEKDDEIDDFEIVKLSGNSEHLDWKTMSHYERGNNPKLCANKEGIIVQIQNSQEIFHIFTGRLSQIGKMIRWKTNTTLDEGCNPSISINSSNIVLFVYNLPQSDAIVSRIGYINPHTLKIDWNTPQYITNGTFPTVSINDNNQVVLSLTRETSKLYSMIGIINPNTKICQWKDPSYFDGGFDNTITLFNNGVVVEVHRSNSHRLWYDVGRIVPDKGIIEWPVNKKVKASWKSNKINNDGYGTDCHITSNHLGHILVVFKSQNNNKLKYHFGHLNKQLDNVVWYNHITFEEGDKPSACLSHYSVATVQISKGELYNRTGLLNSSKLNSFSYEIPKLEFVLKSNENKLIWNLEYGNTVILVHQKSNKYLYSTNVNYTSGSRQQVVSLVDKSSEFDNNILWKIKPIDGFEKKKGPIRQGDLICLEHVSTTKNLHSEMNQRSYVDQSQQEVSCFGSNVGTQLDNWVVKISSEQEILSTGQLFRLMHFSGKFLGSNNSTSQNKLVEVFAGEKLDCFYWYILPSK